MGRKRVIIGQSEWGIADENAKHVAEKIKDAMEGKSVVALPLLDGANRSVTVYLNGATVSVVVVDLDTGPKPPMEISGG